MEYTQPATYVDVSPDARLESRQASLTYAVPATMDVPAVGQLIWVPLRRKLVQAIVVEVHERAPDDSITVRELDSLVDPALMLSPIQWELVKWVSNQTLCSVYEAASLVLPPSDSERVVEHIALIEPIDPALELTRLQRKLVHLLQERGELPLSAAQRALASSLASVVSDLERAGVIRRNQKVQSAAAPAPPRAWHVRLLEGGTPPSLQAHRQLALLEWLTLRLRARPAFTAPLAEMIKASGFERATFNALEQRGLIAIEEADLTADAPDFDGAVQLTTAQQDVWLALRRLLETPEGGKALLHGVTGSGKTELYLRATAHELARDRSVIMLVPEIALSGQVADRFRSRFGDRAIVYHSALPAHERQSAWDRAATGEPLVVIGPRSALFAPLPTVGCIIVDEEHDAAYKQDSSPHYHARTVALKLRELHSASLILGSATPDVETWQRAEAHDWTILELPERVGRGTVDATGRIEPVTIELPPVRIVDMRAELRAGNTSLFSRELRRVLQDRLDREEQVILFLNRRGASTFVQCRNCGDVRMCPDCDIPLVYHRFTNQLLCHRCGRREPPSRTCAVCGSTQVGYYGTGTQRVEDEVQAFLPNARVLRWDYDAVRAGNSHARLRERVLRHEVDIIVGTQMIAKGLDLPDVTAVGVINADTYLYLPDFRATERTYQMLAQVAGRAARRTAGGEVIFQTFTPQHYAIEAAARNDYAGFRREELAFRRTHGYPPYSRLARLLVRDADEGKARAAAWDMAYNLRAVIDARDDFWDVEVIGPAPAFAARVRNRYGWQVLVRGNRLLRLLRAVSIGYGWVIDVDPDNLL